MNKRTIELKENKITVSIRKSKTAKYIKLQMHPIRGIEVVLPFRKSYEHADQIVNDNLNWIVQNHKKHNALQNRYFYLGELITYAKFPKLYEIREQEPLFSKDREVSEKKYDKFLRKNAEIYLTERINLIAGNLDLSFYELKIRKLLNRWGSCSSKKVITLNYKLMKCEPILIDYVIVHELFHLKEMNHSAKFWNLVSQVFPNYKELKLMLKKYYF